jgi:hypothetical protein
MVLEFFFSEPHSASGGGHSTTVINTTGLLPAGWEDATITWTSGVNNGNSYLLLSNTATQLVTQTVMAGIPNNGDTFLLRLVNKESTLYTVKVGGSDAAAFNRTKPSWDSDNTSWTAATSVPHAWLTYGSDISQTVLIHRIAGPVTSFSIFPALYNLTASIVSNDLQITMLPGITVEVTINGDLVNKFFVQAKAPRDAVPGSIINYNGSQVKAAAGSTTYFQAGVSRINPLFLCESTAVAYCDYGSYLLGGFDIRNQSNTTIMGPGIISGEGTPSNTPAAGLTVTVAAGTPGVVTWAVPHLLITGAPIVFTGGGGATELTRGTVFYFIRTGRLTGRVATSLANALAGTAITVAANSTPTVTCNSQGVTTIPFNTAILYAAVLGCDNQGGGTFFNTTNNVVKQVTLLDPATIQVFAGATSVTKCFTMSPWAGGAGSLSPGFDSVTGISLVEDNFQVEGDDCITWNGNAGNAIARRNVIVHEANGCFRISYWPWPEANGRRTFSDNIIRSIAHAHDDVSYFNCIIGALCDGSLIQDQDRVDHVQITNNIVEGNLTCMLFDIRNRLYPYGTQANAHGQICDWLISDFTITGTQGQRSLLKGLDAVNRPHDIRFHNIRANGVLWTSTNWATYVDQNSFASNVVTDPMSPREPVPVLRSTRRI